MKLEILERIEKIREEFENSPLNTILMGASDVGVIVSGTSYNYVLETCEKLKVNPSILKLGTTYPLPKKKIKDFIRDIKTLIVVEELSPYLELNITALAKDSNPDLTIIGKESGHFSEAHEYNVPIVLNVFKEVFNVNSDTDYNKILETAKELKTGIPARIPVFCPGCPHRATFWALQKAIAGKEDKIALMNDIGCYSMLLLNNMIYPKIHGDDLLISMGSDLGVGCGVQLASEEKIITLIGDSTFFHAGLPGMINVVNNQEDMLMFVLDNSVTAMT